MSEGRPTSSDWYADSDFHGGMVPRWLLLSPVAMTAALVSQIAGALHSIPLLIFALVILAGALVMGGVNVRRHILHRPHCALRRDRLAEREARR